MLRGADQLFRLDVDEFVILLPETDLRGARIAGERLLKLVGGLPLPGRPGTQGAPLRVAGAMFPHDRVQSTEDLLREANRVFQELRESADRRVFDA